MKSRDETDTSMSRLDCFLSTVEVDVGDEGEDEEIDGIDERIFTPATRVD